MSATGHHFEANPGMYDSMHRYCTRCGIVETGDTALTARQCEAGKGTDMSTEEGAVPIEIRVGQVWASTHKGDIAAGLRQRREVASWNGYGLVWLRAESTHVVVRPRQPSRVRARRTGEGWTIPGHRLVEDAP